MKRQTIHKIARFIIFCSLVTLTFYLASPTLASDHDFRKIQTHDNFYTNLNGTWHFLPDTLVEPNELSTALETANSQTVTLPGSFEKQIGQKNGYGTYYTTIQIPQISVGQALAIYVPYQYSAYTLFIDGKEIMHNGTVGTNATSHRAEMAPKIGYFTPENNRLELVIQVSSFEHIRGGLENPIRIGNAQVVTGHFIKKTNINLAMASSLTIISLFTLTLVSLRKKEVGFMMFGLFCLLVSIRALFTDPFYYTVMFPKISWLWGTRIEYILSLLSSWVFIILIKSWYGKSFSNKVVVLLSAIILPLAVLTLFTKPVFFQEAFFTIAFLAIPIGLYFIYITYKEIRANNSKAKINGVGIILIFLAFLNDFAIAKNLYQFHPLMLPATAVYVLLHVIQMSLNFSKLVQNKERLNQELLQLNASLDEQVHNRTKELEQANEKLKEQAMIDGLTGIANRRGFNDFFKDAFLQAKQYNEPLALLMIDIDDFKKYNDYFGHVQGDWLLQEVTKVVSAQLSDKHFFARYGGEEFSVILPHTSEQEAYRMADQIRRAVENKQFAHPMGQVKVVTFSIGVAVLTSETNYTSTTALVHEADRRLYEAKESGRNRVV